MSWSEDQVLALAPDPASAKAGKDLARQDKWVSYGKAPKAVWGECKGSGSKPYQTQVDLSNIAFKCSCPSRKFPCKHGLGLMLLYARNESSFTLVEMPAWVSEWITKRAEKEEKKAEKDVQAIKPVDETAQAKRQEKRSNNVKDGIEEMLLWLKDIIRGGILNIPDKPLSYWENLSKRLIDAQAPGLAAMVRNLGNSDFFKEGWQSNFIDQVVRIYLVAKGYQHLEQLPADLQEDIKSFIGFTQSQEELKEKEGITDHWMVLSKQVSQEDNLTTERYWLYGEESKRYALILQFIVRGQSSGAIVLPPGSVFKAELVFYPSASPMRAIIKRQVVAEKKPEISGFEDWETVAREESKLNTLVPCRNERPYIVENIRPVMLHNKWWLADHNNNLFLLNDKFQHLYRLLAVSGGKALKMAVIGKENSFMPLGVWHNSTYYIL